MGKKGPPPPAAEGEDERVMPTPKEKPKPKKCVRKVPPIHIAMLEESILFWRHGGQLSMVTMGLLLLQAADNAR